MDVIRLSIYETYSLTRMKERIFTVVKAKFRLCVFVHKDNSNTSLRVTKVTSVNASHIHMALSRTFLERVCFMLIVCQRFFLSGTNFCNEKKMLLQILYCRFSRC